MTRFDQMVTLERARGLASRRKLADLSAQETDLRQQLRLLRSFRQEVHGADPELSEMKSIGADVLWQRWLDKTQKTLNASLARVLVQKERAQKEARRDIGRGEAVSVLRDANKSERDAERRKSQMEEVLRLAVLQQLAK